MPKILIDEIDRTSPGAAEPYSNYTVLITGLEAESFRFEDDEGQVESAKLSGRLPLYREIEDPESKKTTYVYNRPVKPDDNGVYEFNSAEDFEQTIGLVPPMFTVDVESKAIPMYHYGNQMAYELLSMGYPIIYKPLNPTVHAEPKLEENKTTTTPLQGIKAMADESFWEVFRDKATYDFRFISHGLLRTCDVETEDTSYEKVSDIREKLEKRADDLRAAQTQLERVEEEAEQLAKEAAQKNKKTPTEADMQNYLEAAYKQWILGLDEEGKPIEDANSKLTPSAGFYPINTSSKGTDKDTFKPNEATFTYTLLNNLYASYGDSENGIGAKTGIQNELDLLEENALSNSASDYEKAMAIITWKNKQDEIADNYLTRADLNDANGQIAALAKYADADTDQPGPGELPGRGDCTALIELDERSYEKSTTTDKPEPLIIAAINSLDKVSGDALKGKFCALTVPSIVYKMTEKPAFGNNRKFPGAFHYLACFINSLKLGFAEWYAAAGYTRGVSGLTVDYTTVKLGETAINALEPRNYKDDPNYTYPKFACNVIANFRGSYYLWGNRTCHAIGREGDAKNGDLVASHFLNIRQLCTTIKKQLYVACRRFTFDPNSDTLWFNFVNAIKPTLEAMKADQGIRDYKIVKVFTDKKATLKAKIRIIPIEAVEDFDLEISLEDSFGETTAVVTE